MNRAYLTPAEAAAIDALSPGNQLYGIGQRLKELSDRVGGVGQAVYLDPYLGNDGFDGLSRGTAKASFAEAYRLLRSGYNDVLVYVAGPNSITLPEGFDWAKSYTHLIGICAQVKYAKRARIFQLSTATGVAALFTVSGSGCVIQDIYVFQGVNDNTSKYAFKVTGSRNLIRGVHMAGIGHATMDAAGAGSLLLDGGVENVFEDCAIGLDTIARGANSREIVLDSAASRNLFKRCTIYAYISNAGHALVKVADGTGIDRSLEFEECTFRADSENKAVALTSVFDIPAGIAQGMICLDSKCKVESWGAAASWDSNSRGIISAAMVAPAASAGGGKSTHV